MTTVAQTLHRRGRRDGLTTLEQHFQFQGTTAASIGRVLSGSPLVGVDSIFGSRPGTEGTTATGARTLTGFSPAPGFRFDVEMSQARTGVFLVRFTQAKRQSPYLEGDLVWTIADGADGVDFVEQINTEAAMTVASRPLDGPRPSVRRWLFVLIGHKQVMIGATRNIASLVG